MNLARVEAGVSLIEILIALVILSLGLISIAALQSTAMQTSYGSLQYTLATQLAQGMAERMYANRAQAQAGAYDFAAGTTPGDPTTDCSSATCNAATQASWDMAVFYYTVVGQPGTTCAPSGSAYSHVPSGPNCLLPSAQVSIVCADATCTSSSPHLITIYWDANRAGISGTGCNPTSATDLRCYRLAFVP